MLERWRERDVFAESVRRREAEGAPEWVFYEGPPTANGRPGSHHVLARVFKDVFPRFKTMRGHTVHRKAGWDCHGLPVELEIERELGHPIEGGHRGLRDRRVQCEVPRVGVHLHRRVEPADRADRVLGRYRRRLRHARERVHRVGLVVAKAGLGEGSPLRGPQGRPVLPALRHGALLARGRVRLQGRHRPLGVRALPGCGRGRNLAARMDDDPVDAALERGARGRTPTSTTYARALAVRR